MMEKYFLAAIISLSALFAFWISITPSAVISELAPAVLLALFALVVLARFSSRASGSLMLIYFVAGLLYAVYIYLTTNNAGFLVVAMALINLIGVVLMVGRHPSAAGKKGATASNKAAKSAKLAPKKSAQLKRKSAKKKK